MNTDKLNAFQRRQLDTGWGYAIASSWVPLVGLYYAITRRTITPFLYAIGGTFALTLLVVLGAAIGETDEKRMEQATDIGTLVSLVASPFFVKRGITKARLSAKNELDQAT